MPVAASEPPEPNPCFVDSRRLTGHNRFFAGSGVVLETRGPSAQDIAAHNRWREAALAMCRAIGWGDAALIVRAHASGTLLAFEAPVDTLFTATEVNEWAWEQASGLFEPGFDITAVDSHFDHMHPLGKDNIAVAEVFNARAAAEKNPALVALRLAARKHGIPIFSDDHEVSLGAGAGSRTWPLTSLPGVGDVAWDSLRDIPKVLVTGSNGKTTTVRLLAALLTASDEKFRGHVGYSSTEGVVIGAEPAGDGDFSGPAGARLVLRDLRVEAAILETARGGILRRGLAIEKAEVAIVTNISADHFGEYGIDSLDDLAEVKLVVARALGTAGTLVLNADDPALLARAAKQECSVALFAFDDAHPALVSLREASGSTFGLIDEQLWLTHRGVRSLLGELRELPLTLNGAAMYNIANIAAAALAASALGVSPAVIATELKRFGSTRFDNSGRLDRWSIGKVTVLIDYAHNPAGLAGLLLVGGFIALDRISKGHFQGRIGLLLGQAGNRSDQAIAELAQVAAVAKPDFIVIKENAGMLRGRALGEVPALLKNNLLAAGYPPENIQTEADEVDAARQLLRWAQPGDVLVLPIHQSASRKVLSALLDEMEKCRWQAGTALPIMPDANLPA